jgi:formylglycine-generating enzyme required for sulfatase activity
MKGVRAYVVIGCTAVCVAAAVPARAVTLKCPPDSVKVGPACIDLYEASVWQIAPTNTKLVKKVQDGKATLADLTAGGATQLSSASLSGCSPGFPANFPNTGNWTPVQGSNAPSPGVYAVSIPGVHPSSCITWFQANQACLLSGKRLLTNREWQGAAAGTPDPGTDNGTSDCNISTAGDAVNTGSRSSCKSAWGVFDMVGNVDEWVADWADLAPNCTDWTTSAGIPGRDLSCFGGPGGAGVNSLPGALLRGGSFFFGGSNAGTAGVFAVSAFSDPSIFGVEIGFRCAR